MVIHHCCTEATISVRMFSSLVSYSALYRDRNLDLALSFFYGKTTTAFEVAANETNRLQANMLMFGNVVFTMFTFSV